MADQLLITLGREYGTYGHKLGRRLAEEFGIKYYDRNILNHLFEDEKVVRKMHEFEEKNPKPLLSRNVRGFSNTIQDNLAQMEFEFILQQAQSGESFVLVGRCGNHVLRNYEGLISFFILGDMYDKIKHVEKLRGMSEKDAINAIQRHDRSRKHYHNAYSDIKWGDSRGYDLCLNSTRLGIEKSVKVLADYVRVRRGMK